MVNKSKSKHAILYLKQKKREFPLKILRAMLGVIKCKFKVDGLDFQAEMRTDSQFKVFMYDGSSAPAVVDSIADVGQVISRRKQRNSNFRVILYSPCYIVSFYGISLFSAASQVFAFFLAGVGFLSSGVLAATKFTRVGKSEVTRSQDVDLSGTIALGFLLIGLSTAGFTTFSVGLYKVGIVSFKGGALHGTHLVHVVYSSYLWHLLAAVPLLAIPQTLNWSLEYPATGNTQGILTLAYILTVVIPIVSIGKQLLDRWLNNEKAAS